MRTMIDDPAFVETDRSSVRCSRSAAREWRRRWCAKARPLRVLVQRTYGSTEYPTLTTGAPATIPNATRLPTVAIIA
jgi:hypothetical protein